MVRDTRDMQMMIKEIQRVSTLKSVRERNLVCKTQVLYSSRELVTD